MPDHPVRKPSKAYEIPGPAPRRDYPDAPGVQLLQRLHAAKRARGWGSQHLANQLQHAAPAITGEDWRKLTRHRIDEIEKGKKQIATEAGVRAWADCVHENPDELVELWRLFRPTPADNHDKASAHVDAAKPRAVPVPQPVEIVTGLIVDEGLGRPERLAAENGTLAAVSADAASPTGLRHRRRRYVIAGSAVMAVVAVLVSVWILRAPGAAAGPTCADVGNRTSGQQDVAVGAAFLTAYRAAGGPDALGCPLPETGGDTSGYVHPWGKGLSQDLQGPHDLSARIMQLDPAHQVVVLSGALNNAYTQIRGHDTAPIVGYPASAPVKCGDTQVVELDGGSDGSPSGMALASDSKTWIWLPPGIWIRYRQLGAGAGRLGAPTPGQASSRSSATTVRFEHGTLTITPYADDHAVTDLERAGKPESTATVCPA